MRIQMKKNKDPKRVQRVLEELIRQLEQLTFMGPDGTQDKTRKISISSLNIYIYRLGTVRVACCWISQMIGKSFRKLIVILKGSSYFQTRNNNSTSIRCRVKKRMRSNEEF